VIYIYQKIFLFGLLTLGVSGCATQADIQAEQRAREALRSQVVTDSRTSLDELRREVQKVRGEVEEIRYRLDRASKERVGTGPQIKLLEDRIALLEKQMKARGDEQFTPPFGATDGANLRPNAEMLPGQPQPGTPGASSALLGTRSGGEETSLAKETPEVQDEYSSGLVAFQEQQYDKAIQQFRSFQRKYPSSEMADDAQYWIGESYFRQRDFNRAILEFNDVLKYRKGDRVPAALLRQAQAFIEIGDKTDARLILQKLLNDHPKSLEAQEAKARLQDLGR